jgi:hypothetical protein
MLGTGRSIQFEPEVLKVGCETSSWDRAEPSDEVHQSRLRTAL